MKIFGSWSIISFLRFAVQLIWAVLLVTIVGQFLMLGIFIYSGGEIWGTFSVYLDSSFLVDHLKEILADEQAFLFSGGSVKMSYVPLHGELFLRTLLWLIQIGLIGLALYGFSVLKRVLNAMHMTDTFTIQNGSDIRIVGFLLIVAAPLRFLFEWGVKLYFESHVMTDEITAVLPPFDFTFFFAGLVCFVIAEILNQASIMHEEQKLTV
ncbi:DUF2975 domain-containing protein [Rhodohalobacter sp.]|uniref:DUF2975 domain-containing protein n=1 Tax=Rhodohalobacter sp. TaxID=1974210 RepID=UPI002ACE8B3A|nr:DUF2975 domain-containing protein [Rhodohalobacter sp.]MDZ7758417.1 DUF2975 domain-containing protein [Rhodohalobacter sp.]